MLLLPLLLPHALLTPNGFKVHIPGSPWPRHRWKKKKVGEEHLIFNISPNAKLLTNMLGLCLLLLLTSRTKDLLCDQRTWDPHPSHRQNNLTGRRLQTGRFIDIPWRKRESSMGAIMQLPFPMTTLKISSHVIGYRQKQKLWLYMTRNQKYPEGICREGRWGGKAVCHTGKMWGCSRRQLDPSASGCGPILCSPTTPLCCQ